jgi:hypothetical protein
MITINRVTVSAAPTSPAIASAKIYALKRATARTRGIVNMVIGPGKQGVAAFVILGDGELLPERLNSIKVLVFRQGNSTGRQLLIVKPLGQLAPIELLYKAEEPEETPCPGLTAENDPIHEHDPGQWFFYESTWTLEHGPYLSEGECRIAAEIYKDTEKEALTKQQEIDSLSHAKPKTAVDGGN